MKDFFLLASILWCSFLLAQNSLIIPPDSIKIAFEKKFPKKKPIWSIEYSSRDMKFIASFTQSPNLKAFAVYDENAFFKAYKVQISIEKLPQKAKKYLDKDYPKSIKQILFVVDEKNVETYEVGVTKDKKNYKIVFDKNGDLKKRIQIE